MEAIIVTILKRLTGKNKKKVSMGGPNMRTEEWGFLTRGQNLVTKITGEGNVQRLRWADR